MMDSIAYKDLSNDGRALLLACKREVWSVQVQPESKRPKMQQDNGEYKTGDFWFTMNRAKWSDKYNVFPKGSKDRAYAVLAELVKNGFIDVILSGRISRTNSIYAMSERWKNYPGETE